MRVKTDSSALNSQPVLFDLEELGLSLREVAVDIMHLEKEEVISRWFHSKKDADLLIWTDGKQSIIKHQVTFFGQVVEWNIIDGIKTGVVIEEELSENEGELSEVIRFDEVAQVSTINQAIKLIGHVTELREDDRDLLLKHLMSPQAQKNARHQLASVLASPLNEPHRPSFWKRLRNWFSG